jgi:hypothetical protein
MGKEILFIFTNSCLNGNFLADKKEKRQEIFVPFL